MGLGRASYASIAAPTKDQRLRRQYFEFKYLYFRVQALVNKLVTLSLKYDQLKLPEIHLAVVKPLGEQVFAVADSKVISQKVGRYVGTTANVELTPRFGGTNYHTVEQLQLLKISTQLVFILLLLRREYLVQAENNLVIYELLTTKANVCEILAIRSLREYDSFHRTNQLFVAPLANEMFPAQMRRLFTTLELLIVAEAKKFLSQPIIVKTINRFYNGELIFTDGDPTATPETGLLSSPGVANYQFEKIAFTEVVHRASVVPKYQALVGNVRLFFFFAAYFAFVSLEPGWYHMAVEGLFWVIVINFNLEMALKLATIEFRYLRLVVWTHIDLVLLVLLNILLGLRLCHSPYFADLFSLVPIVLLPRLLLIFNNYKFFNLLVLSFHRMALNLVGLACLFFTLILGFYVLFVTLSITQLPSEILFNMVKIFFGFTPSVWNNWDDFNTLGKVILMAYLFLIEFIISSILAILLSGVFARVNESLDEEFNNMQAINLVLAFKVGKLNLKMAAAPKIPWLTPYNLLVHAIYLILYVLKLPLIFVIYGYEISKSTPTAPRKGFVYLSKDQDIYRDDDCGRFEDFEVGDPLNMAKLRRNLMFKRNPSAAEPRISFFGIRQGPAVGSLPNSNAVLKTVPSASTLGAANLRSASTDLAFIDELLQSRYPREHLAPPALGVMVPPQPPTDSLEDQTATIMTKLQELELMLRQITSIGVGDHDSLVLEYPVFDHTGEFTDANSAQQYDLDDTY